MTTETILTDDLSLIEQLREYAADNGYSHNDYADTMTAAADALEQSGLQSPEVQRLRRLAKTLDEKIEAYERYGPICTFESDAIIHASHLYELREAMDGTQ